MDARGNTFGGSKAVLYGKFYYNGSIYYTEPTWESLSSPYDYGWMNTKINKVNKPTYTKAHAYPVFYAVGNGESRIHVDEHYLEIKH